MQYSLFSWAVKSSRKATIHEEPTDNIVKTQLLMLSWLDHGNSDPSVSTLSDFPTDPSNEGDLNIFTNNNLVKQKNVSMFERNSRFRPVYLRR